MNLSIYKWLRIYKLGYALRCTNASYKIGDRTALIKDGWNMTHDPLQIKVGGVDMAFAGSRAGAIARLMKTAIALFQ
ncbi:element excision factor XisH family protein [Chlorogloeopsis fritschii PCC 9212]|uniref:Uncharacterized protein n=1 Tax=Chlorogloeopsis fritschii PCC 6912 TaxID=211165 RepID=A0A3S0ZK42_CHLFR|nr:element excision factor XisH family protein [Chlorogloeopsis fritschii]RUR72028.1 hypothetical protein PCC6912_65780 [Chlorogloeopsis fritschii PCC 6912]